MSVIPAKAGIQCIQILIKPLDTGFPSRAVERSPVRRLFTRSSKLEKTTLKKCIVKRQFTPH